jgi:hypothetical protein
MREKRPDVVLASSAGCRPRSRAGGARPAALGGRVGLPLAGDGCCRDPAQFDVGIDDFFPAEPSQVLDEVVYSNDHHRRR